MPLLKTLKWVGEILQKGSGPGSATPLFLPSAPATLSNLLFLIKARHNPASGLLLSPNPLPGPLFP